jgi:hypothetical protein
MTANKRILRGLLAAVSPLALVAVYLGVTPASAGAVTGTLTVTAGSLTLTSPTSLTWAVTLNGTNQTAVDSVAGDQQYTVNDATGSGAGWHVTTSATTFTNGTHTLLDSGTFVNTGSITSIAAATAPTATCVATCVLPTNTTTYPVAITTAPSTPTAVTIYDTSAATGVGQVTIGGHAAANPVGWWVNVPSSAFAGAYTSTVTMAIVSAP